MKLVLNREYLLRHLFAAAVFACLGVWFAYDAFVAYPAMDAAALYEKIEGAAPKKGFALESFKAQKIKTQRGFAFLALAAFAVVAARLSRSAALKVDFDDKGFTFRSRRFSYGDIAKIDDSDWEKKGVSRIAVRKDGFSAAIVLDSWHHKGAGEFHSMAVSQNKEAQSA